MDRSKGLTRILALLVLVVLAAGCATKKYVRSEVGATEERAAERIEVMQSQIENAEIKLAEHDEQLEGLSSTARDALDRAIAAGKLAEGKFLFERVLSDDLVRFDFDGSELSGDAKNALDIVASDLISEGGDVYVEVQGHTDSVGTEDYNLTLGHRRAETVQRYLNQRHGIPLHRMSVISYGETAPVGENSTREERARNRRVALVVLK
ncbi:MAG: OmpA family protein [Acidobacteriota bacterium]|nr:OmpA family protein [Acidobacteriota bacterium]